MFTSEPTDIYKTELQFKRVQETTLEEAKQVRKAFRKQKEASIELQIKQHLWGDQRPYDALSDHEKQATKETQENQEAIVNP